MWSCSRGLHADSSLLYIELNQLRHGTNKKKIHLTDVGKFAYEEWAKEEQRRWEMGDACRVVLPTGPLERPTQRACRRRRGADQWWSGNRCRLENTLAGSDRSVDRLASWCRSIQETRVGDACALDTDATSTPPVDEKDAERQPSIFYAPSIHNSTIINVIL